MNKKGNLRGFWAIIALTAVIGFMTGCDSPTKPGGGFVAVSSITGVPTSSTVGYLPLYGTVNPAGATNKTIVWSVYYAGETGASISGNILTTAAAGTVIITATIADGAAKGINYTQSFTITINPAGGNPSSAITYEVIQTGGEDGVTGSTGIVFTFSASVDSLGLTADNITVSGAAEKDAAATLSGSGTSRTLAPIIVNAAGLATVAIAKDGIEAVAKNVIVYRAGEYVPEYWSITWHLNGGTAGADAQYPTLIVKGAVLARPSPDPTKADNTFDDWYTDSALTQTYDFDNPVTANLNLYAKWEAGQTNSDTITYTVEQIGGEDGVTDSTGIMFTFSASVDSLNLTAGNIYVKGEAVKGAAALTESGTIRVLSPITVNAAGLVTVYIIKDGIEAETKHIIVYKAGQTVPGTAGLSFELINNGTAYRVRAGTVTGGAVIIPATYEGLPVTEIGSADDGWDEGAFEITYNSPNTGPTSITIPASVTTIGIRAFRNCSSLETVTFAESSQLKSIGIGAFSFCTSLTGITIPASVMSIGTRSGSEDSGAFSFCESLASVIFEAGSQIQSIGIYVFYHCESLTSINIPASVTSIGGWAFAGCTSLTEITILKGVTSIDSGAFSGWTASQTIYVEGYASEAAADAAWPGIYYGINWRSDCNAVINYLGLDIDGIAAQVWREDNAVSLTAPQVNAAGRTVTAQGWQISDTGSSGWTNFTPPSTADMSYNGKSLRYYATSGGSTYYSNTVTIRVISATTQEVTIAMWDDDGDGWNFDAALRINVNGTNLSSNVRLPKSNGPIYYMFDVETGDVVQIYWVNGGQYDYECAFAVYYSDDPPNPAFNPSSGTTDTIRVLVSKRYNNPSGVVGNGTLMGSFTVP